MAFSRVAASSDVKLNQIKAIQVAGKTLVLVRSAHGLAALDSRCTHFGADLCKGDLEAGEIVCPKHGARFDAHSGEPKGKATMLIFKMQVKALNRYEVKEEGGSSLPEATGAGAAAWVTMPVSVW